MGTGIITSEAGLCLKNAHMSLKVTAARRARSRLYEAVQNVGLDRKRGSVILQRSLPGGSIVVNTSKASSRIVLE